MIKLKDIKEHFYSTACLTKDKMYNIYNVSRSGEYSSKLYLGYVMVNNGKATHYPTGKIVDDINELNKVANEWADNAEYEPTTYNPDFRKSYVAERRICDHLEKLGFNKKPMSYKYELSLSHIKSVGKISITLELIDGLSDEFSIYAAANTGDYSWVDLSSNDYKEIIENINSFIQTVTLCIMCTSLNVYNKTTDGNLENIDKLLIKYVSLPLNIKETSFKSYLIDIMENTLNVLKNSNI